MSKYWQEIKDADPRGTAIFSRHYSCYNYADGRKRTRFVGPGERIVLLSHDEDALFVWKKFRDASGQTGINCSVFRNESKQLASLMILDAETWAHIKWPGERLYTYISEWALMYPAAVWALNSNFWHPNLISVIAQWAVHQFNKTAGFCFVRARWKKLSFKTKKRKLLIFVKEQK